MSVIPKGYKSDITDPLLDWNPSEWVEPGERLLRKMYDFDPDTGLLTEEAYQLRLQWAAKHRWLLVRNVHRIEQSGKIRAGEFLTKHGIPKPFNGTAPLFALLKKITDPEGTGTEELQIEMFETLMEIGAIEPITTAKAAQYLERIKRAGTLLPELGIIRGPLQPVGRRGNG